jgi:hypothetical protein
MRAKSVLPQAGRVYQECNMDRNLVAALFGGTLALTSLPGLALDQWAAKVVAYSSEFSSKGWSAKQALGPPNVHTYGDYPKAWSPSSTNGTFEFITVSYPLPVYATGVTVRETDGWGFVTSVDVTDLEGKVHTVWSGTDDSLPNQINDFLVTFPQTAYLVTEVTVHTNTSLTNGWEEVDSIQLHGLAPVSGSLSERMGHTATLKCTNVTTGQSLTVPLTGSGSQGPVSYWDCDQAGLKSKAGQDVRVEIETTLSQ